MLPEEPDPRQLLEWLLSEESDLGSYGWAGLTKKLLVKKLKLQ